jgi:putative oxidoreductase
MQNYGDIFAPLIGRILVGGFFIWSGIEATLNFPNAVAAMINLGAPMPTTLAIIAITIEVLGGMAMVVGFKTRLVALMLSLYVIIVAFFYTGFATDSSQALFFQDMAIIGGLLYISAYGAGSWAPDWHYKK